MRCCREVGSSINDSEIGHPKETDLIQIIRVLEAALAAVAVVWRMFFLYVVIQRCLVLEDVVAIAGDVTLEPVHRLLVFET